MNCDSAARNFSPLQNREPWAVAIESAGTGVVIADPTLPDCPIMFCNSAFLAISGYDRGEVIGRNCRFLQGPETDADVVSEMRTAIREARSFTGTLRNFRKDGTPFWNELTVNPVFDEQGCVTNFVGIQSDVTARVDAQAALHRAKNEAEHANRAKSEFLSRMSHELRTPLNAILGFAQLLEGAEPTPLQHERLDHILRAGRHLLALINEVLDVARIEAGKTEISLESVPVGTVAEEALSMLRPLAEARSVQLICAPIEAPSACVFVDRQRLKQVLLNLVGNAVKYHRPRGGAVTVSWRLMPAERLRISVADDGPGIAEEKKERLFVPFDRLDAERTEVHGTGLGLALSKRLAELMGGSIGVQTRLGEGSTFWIQVPRAAPADARPAEPAPVSDRPANASATGRRVVLHVEDDAANLKRIENVLGDQSAFELISANRGNSALELARERLPDLILLDLDLPDLPGLELLAQLKNEPRTRRIPVIVLSADAAAPHWELARRAGAAECLTKPINVLNFLQILDRMLNLKTSIA